jgi:hypothetical protein
VTQLKTWLAEGVKFGATVGVWLLFNKIAPDFDDLRADAAKQIITALIAGVVTFGLLDLLLGRPLIKLVWSQAGKAIPDRRPDLHLPFPNKRILRVDVMVEGKTPVALFADWLSRKLGIRCVLTMKPRGTARCVLQASPTGVVLSGNAIEFDLVDGLSDGINSYVEFSVSPQHASTSANRVDCRVELRTPSGHTFWIHCLVRRDSGIDGFALGG